MKYLFPFIFTAVIALIFGGMIYALGSGNAQIGYAAMLSGFGSIIIFFARA